MSIRKIRVIHVAGQLDIGGLEKLLVEFARHANRDFFELVFVSLAGKGLVAEEIEALGYPVHTLDIPTGLRFRGLNSLGRLFRSLKPDVIHSHNLRPLIYSSISRLMGGIPALIHTCHGTMFGATRREATTFRLATKACRRVVCVSSDSMAACLNRGVRRQTVTTVINGIDTERFPSAAPEGSGSFVAVGRLSSEKGFADLVRACRIAREQDPSFRLEIAGDGACRPELEKMITEYRLSSNLTLLGKTRDIPSLLARASGFVLASLTEGISLTILEAMAAGLPVIATNVGGNPEVISHGQTGYLTTSGDSPEMAARLIELWHSPEKRLLMGQAGRERVRRHFEVRRTIAEYERIYEESLGHPRRGTAC